MLNPALKLCRSFEPILCWLEREDEWEPPDILMIDGGKGQLNAALEAFAALQTSPPTLCSLAKREEEIYLPGDAPPIRLRRHNAGLRERPPQGALEVNAAEAGRPIDRVRPIRLRGFP